MKYAGNEQQKPGTKKLQSQKQRKKAIQYNKHIVFNLFIRIYRLSRDALEFRPKPKLFRVLLCGRSAK